MPACRELMDSVSSAFLEKVPMIPFKVLCLSSWLLGLYIVPLLHFFYSDRRTGKELFQGRQRPKPRRSGSLSISGVKGFHCLCTALNGVGAKTWTDNWDVGKSRKLLGWKFWILSLFLSFQYLPDELRKAYLCGVWLTC